MEVKEGEKEKGDEAGDWDGDSPSMTLPSMALGAEMAAKYLMVSFQREREAETMAWRRKQEEKRRGILDLCEDKDEDDDGEDMKREEIREGMVGICNPEDATEDAKEEESDEAVLESPPPDTAPVPVPFSLPSHIDASTTMHFSLLCKQQSATSKWWK